MQRARKGWVRGAAVIGVAGAMMAVALLSPALAAKKPATKKFVTQQINAATTDLKTQIDAGDAKGRIQTFVRSDPFTVPANNAAAREVACPSGMIATGGGFFSNGPLRVAASVPTDGTGNFASSFGGSGVGMTGWGVILFDSGTGPFQVRVYATCRTGTSANSNYPSGGPPLRSDGA